MSAETRNASDRAFALETGEALSSTFDGGGSVALAVDSITATGRQLLAAVEQAVSSYIDRPWRVRPEPSAGLAKEIGEVLNMIDYLEPLGIPTLLGLNTGFDADPVINLTDTYTAMRFAQAASLPEPILVEDFDRWVATDARIRLTNARDARRNLITLLADAMRFSSRSAPTISPGKFSFTVHTKKQQYVLDCWPHWGTVTRRAFGTTATSPVTGSLSSGRWYFEGLKGTRIENDGRLYQVNATNTSATLNW